MYVFNTSIIIRILFGWKNLSIDNSHEVPFEGYSFSSRIMVNMYVRNRWVTSQWNIINSTGTDLLMPNSTNTESPSKSECICWIQTEHGCLIRVILKTRLGVHYIKPGRDMLLPRINMRLRGWTIMQTLSENTRRARITYFLFPGLRVGTWRLSIWIFRRFVIAWLKVLVHQNNITIPFGIEISDTEKSKIEGHISETEKVQWWS